MFHISNVRSKYLLILSIALLVPYLFRSSYVWDSYWEEYYSTSTSGLSSIAFMFIFASLLARSEYVHRALLSLAGVWAIANFIPQNFNEWNGGSFESFLAIILYVIGFVTLGSVILSEKAFLNFQIGSYFNRLAQSQHKIFSAIWVLVTVAISLLLAWATFEYEYETSANSVLKTLAVFITVISASDFIHRFFEENSAAISSFVGQLNDFSINSYLTRKISSWMYGLIHTSILLGALYLVPYLLSMEASSNWILIIGFPILAPIAIVTAYLVIMVIRLAFEYSNALIHVAENTSKR